MARIAGVDIPREKRTEVALTYIYGIGPTISKKILKEANVDNDIRVKDLNDQDLTKLRNIIEKQYQVEGDLRREVQLEYQKTDGYRLLQRVKTQKRSSCQRTEDTD